MIVLVSGSRKGFKYREFVEHFEDQIDVSKVVEIVAGGAKGIDIMAKCYAVKNNIKFTEMFADWDVLGNKAGVLRNIDMLEYVKGKAVCRADIKVIAFRHDFSSGTTHMIKTAKAMGLDLIIVDKNSFDFN